MPKEGELLDKEAKLKVLTDLIAINSVNGNEITVAQYLANFLNSYGVETKIDRFADNKANLIAEFGRQKNNKVFCLAGHQDTVAVNDETKWQTNPFKARVVGDKVFGRGSADMKSGLAAEVIALAELIETGWQPGGIVRFVATAGEEFGAPGAYRLANQGVIDDVDRMIVGEPTNGQIVYAHAGTINYQVKSYGRAVHSSFPESGINAINGLVKYIDAENTLFNQDPGDETLGKVKHSITLVNGGAQINIIPDYAELSGNIRPTPSFSNEQIVDIIAEKIAQINQQTDYKLVFSVLHNFYPVKVNPQSKFVQQAAKIAAKHFSKAINLKVINGATDASVFTQRNPQIQTIILGPATWENAHQINEFTTISSFLATCGTYQEIIKAYFE